MRGEIGEQICRATGIEDDFESHIAWITNQAAFWQDLARRASVIAAYCKKYNPDYVPLGLGQEFSCYSHPRYEFCGGGER
jgi:hypothetical protein